MAVRVGHRRLLVLASQAVASPVARLHQYSSVYSIESEPQVRSYSDSIDRASLSWGVSRSAACIPGFLVPSLLFRQSDGEPLYSKGARCYSSQSFDEAGTNAKGKLGEKVSAVSDEKVVGDNAGVDDVRGGLAASSEAKSSSHEAHAGREAGPSGRVPIDSPENLITVDRSGLQKELGELRKPICSSASH